MSVTSDQLPPLISVLASSRLGRDPTSSVHGVLAASARSLPQVDPRLATLPQAAPAPAYRAITRSGLVSAQTTRPRLAAG